MAAKSLENVTALILTYNEAANIERTLAPLAPLRRVVVIDSGSEDGTQDILARYPNVEVVTRPFDSFAGQCNFGLEQAGIDTEWVLSLDADYRLEPDLVAELAALRLDENVGGYRARFRYCIYGRAIRSGIYPPVIVLFRRKGARYVQDGHAHRVVVTDPIVDLQARILHDDRKPFTRWLQSQRAYAQNEAEHLEGQQPSSLRWQDRLRLMIGFAPPAMFAYVFILRGGFLDGWRGLYYALQRTYAELLLSLELLDRRLRRNP
jgi:cellulose synthase/poly-beta-1,6-N-acetylglucosamine synthase-like glycosyltransferase